MHALSGAPMHKSITTHRSQARHDNHHGTTCLFCYDLVPSSHLASHSTHNTTKQNAANLQLLTLPCLCPAPPPPPSLLPSFSNSSTIIITFPARTSSSAAVAPCVFYLWRSRPSQHSSAPPPSRPAAVLVEQLVEACLRQPCLFLPLPLPRLSPLPPPPRASTTLPPRPTWT